MTGTQQVVRLEVRLGLEDVLRAMGCRDRRRVSPPVLKAAERILEAGGTVLADCVYSIHNVVGMTDTQIELQGCPPICGPIAGFVKPARRVAVFVLTLGWEIEKRAQRLLTQGALFEGYAWNAVGSAGADLAVDALTQHLLACEVRPDEAVTPPFSPGYCGMGLDQQKVVFEILDPSVIGVRLTETCMMQPAKSVSGLLGIGPEAEVRERGVPCQWCDLETCSMRRG